MNRDALKTIGAIVLIAIIVVATFLYGNQQRQAQLRKDQQVKQDQQKTAQTTTQTTVSPTVSSTATPDTSNSGTAPVQKPAQNDLQAPASGVGGGTAPQNTPNTGGQPQTTPDTGGELGYVLPLAALIGLYSWNRRQARLVLDALRSK